MCANVAHRTCRLSSVRLPHDLCDVLRAPGRNATRVDVRFTAFSLKLGALPALSLPLDLFSPTGAPLLWLSVNPEL